MTRCYYETLGVERNASDADLKKAFHQAAEDPVKNRRLLRYATALLITDASYAVYGQLDLLLVGALLGLVGARRADLDRRFRGLERQRSRASEELVEDAVVDGDVVPLRNERPPPRPVEVAGTHERGGLAEVVDLPRADLQALGPQRTPELDEALLGHL